MSLVETRLWLGGMPAETSAEDVRERFESFGTISKVELVTGIMGDLKCVYFNLKPQSETAVKGAIRSLNGTSWAGKTVRVEVAKPTWQIALSNEKAEWEAKMKKEEEEKKSKGKGALKAVTPRMPKLDSSGRVVKRASIPAVLRIRAPGSAGLMKTNIRRHRAKRFNDEGILEVPVMEKKKSVKKKSKDKKKDTRDPKLAVVNAKVEKKTHSSSNAAASLSAFSALATTTSPVPAKSAPSIFDDLKSLDPVVPVDIGDFQPEDEEGRDAMVNREEAQAPQNPAAAPAIDMEGSSAHDQDDDDDDDDDEEEEEQPEEVPDEDVQDTPMEEAMSDSEEDSPMMDQKVEEGNVVSFDDDGDHHHRHGFESVNATSFVNKHDHPVDESTSESEDGAVVKDVADAHDASDSSSDDDDDDDDEEEETGTGKGDSDVDIDAEKKSALSVLKSLLPDESTFIDAPVAKTGPKGGVAPPIGRVDFEDYEQDAAAGMTQKQALRAELMRIAAAKDAGQTNQETARYEFEEEPETVQDIVQAKSTPAPVAAAVAVGRSVSVKVKTKEAAMDDDVEDTADFFADDSPTEDEASAAGSAAPGPQWVTARSGMLDVTAKAGLLDSEMPRRPIALGRTSWGQTAPVIVTSGSAFHRGAAATKPQVGRRAALMKDAKSKHKRAIKAATARVLAGMGRGTNRR